MEIKKEGTKALATERLKLRKFDLSDANDVLELLNDDEVQFYLPEIPICNSKRMAVKYLKKEICSQYKNNYYYNWAIVLKKENKVIGRIGSANIDTDRRKIELYWLTSKNYRCKGFLTEALQTIVNYLKDQGFERIFAYAHQKNEASKKVMIKIGMQFEGTLRKFDKLRDGSLYDVDMYSIIS